MVTTYNPYNDIGYRLIINNDNRLTVSVDLYILDNKYYKYNTQKAFASIKLSAVLHIERQSDTKCLSESPK